MEDRATAKPNQSIGNRGANIVQQINVVGTVHLGEVSNSSPAKAGEERWDGRKGEFSNPSGRPVSGAETKPSSRSSGHGFLASLFGRMTILTFGAALLAPSALQLWDDHLREETSGGTDPSSPTLTRSSMETTLDEVTSGIRAACGVKAGIKVAVKLVISGETGQVTAVTVLDRSLKDQPLRECIESEIEKVQFPRVGGNRVFRFEHAI
ncbi:hypothetical protein ACNOYE_36240 [Nannocystaceae bacterium ST9]